MTEQEWTDIYLLRALNRRGPTTPAVLAEDVRQQTLHAGLLPPELAARIDAGLLERDRLIPWGCESPPLLDFGYDPADARPGGNVRRGAPRLYALTPAGEEHLHGLERGAGVLG